LKLTLPTKRGNEAKSCHMFITIRGTGFEVAQNRKSKNTGKTHSEGPEKKAREKDRYLLYGKRYRKKQIIYLRDEFRETIRVHRHRGRIR